MMLTWICIFVGVLFSQLLYVGANWYQYKRRDYVSYFFYILFLLAYFVILHQDLFFFATKENDLAYVTMRFILRPLAFIIYAVYFEFVIDFLETAKHFNRSHQHIKLTRNVLLGFAAAFVSINVVFGVDGAIANTVYHILNLFIFTAIFFLIISLWKQRTALSNYIFRGALAAAIGALISNIFGILHLFVNIKFVEFNMMFVAMGVMIELYFFNSGLSFKSRQTELNMIESQQQLIEELERSKALEASLSNIRQKISRDMHDEIGATLSGIAMYSYITKEQIKNGQHEAVNISLDLIRENAGEMVAKLNDIIWAVNPVEDHLLSFIERLREFTFQIAAVKGIKVVFDYDETSLQRLALRMEQRKNIYLICKEAINNVVKYSDATLLKIKMEVTATQFEIRIIDDGVGFDPNLVAKGNGLVNMAIRAEEIEATFTIDGRTGRGTVVTLVSKIT